MQERPTILIYSGSRSARADYIFTHLFGRLLGFAPEWTADRLQYANHEGPRLCYDAEILPGGLHCSPGGMLASGDDPVTFSASYPWAPSFGYERGEATISLKSDVFSAAFYLLARCEEYMPFRADAYGRFPASESLLHRLGLLREPLVDQWVALLSDIIEGRWPGALPERPSYAFLPTYDIDVAFAYRGRPFWRSAGGMLRSLGNGALGEAGERLAALAGRRSDPYDVYTFLEQLHHAHSLTPLYFFLVRRHGELDKGLDPRHPAMSRLIHQLRVQGYAGIHPSVASAGSQGMLTEEVQRLEGVLGERVTRSRQHYLMLHLPHTLRSMAAAGITDDHTMGFADQIGFRAGTSRPFPFYDLPAEEGSSLMLHPFAVMDGTLKDYLRMDPLQAKQAVDLLIEKVRAVRGCFSSLWHNTSLTERDGWEGWKEVYLHLVNAATG